MQCDENKISPIKLYTLSGIRDILYLEVLPDKLRPLFGELLLSRDVTVNYATNTEVKYDNNFKKFITTCT